MDPDAERALVELKAELESLNYNRPLGLESAPLVRQMLDDLILTTEKYEELRHKSSSAETNRDLAQNQVCCCGPWAGLSIARQGGAGPALSDTVLFDWAVSRVQVYSLRRDHARLTRENNQVRCVCFCLVVWLFGLVVDGFLCGSFIWT